MNIQACSLDIWAADKVTFDYVVLESMPVNHVVGTVWDKSSNRVIENCCYHTPQCDMLGTYPNIPTAWIIHVWQNFTRKMVSPVGPVSPDSTSNASIYKDIASISDVCLQLSLSHVMAVCRYNIHIASSLTPNWLSTVSTINPHLIMQMMMSAACMFGFITFLSHVTVVPSDLDNCFCPGT